jgi:predicted amidohydrolase
VKVALVQHDVVWEDASANYARLAPMIRGAARDGAGLIVLTEMFATGFSMATERIAEPFDGPSASFLAQQAREHEAWVCGSVAEQAPGDPADAKPGNVLVFAAPDGTLHRYTKIHPFSYAREHERFRAGDESLTLEIGGIRVSGFVCYDLRFADEFWAVADATDCYVVVANWPDERREHWRALLVARAIENEAYVIGVNRVGRGGRLQYDGDSLAVSPWGEVLVDGGRAGEVVLFVDVDVDVVRETRARFPFLDDRR